MNKTRFSERAVLITGCSSGIGKACALGLHQRGYRVFASGRRLEALASLAEGGIETVQLDVTDDDSIKKAVQLILDKTEGSLYSVFNNAGYGQLGAVEDLNRAQMQAQFDTNVFGMIRVTQAVLPIFRQQGYGRIIQNSSILGLVARTFSGAYTASKFAVEGFSDTLRLELHKTGIFVSIVEPGPIHSLFRTHAFKQVHQVDMENSHYADTYKALLEKGPDAKALPFMLGPEAVLKVLIHALESRRPKARYPVTVYGHMFSHLKRWLPTGMLDKILLRA
jgi:NAD(P)-dependent dehydrogenase (short-subunit alcohol dehydrogenase family)